MVVAPYTMRRRKFLQILTLAGASLASLFRVPTAGAQVNPIIAADPSELTLAPGETAMVMVSVDPASDYGIGSVSVSVTVPDPYDGRIEGLTAVTVPAGQHWHITGDVNLTGDLIVEGLLTGVDTFTLIGNGHQLLMQKGGRLDLAGVQKSGWVRWGEPAVGWQVGDRLAVAPMSVGVYGLAETVWGGTWAATSRPVTSPAVTLFNGEVRQPEVANLSQTVVLKGLRRVHFHDGAGVQNLKWLKVLDAGVANTLAQYPIHFHLNGETSRGSMIEGVVVEGGRNHAFVPHGSHGIMHRDCVAYKTIDDAFWWDLPADNANPPGMCANCDPSVLAGQICPRCGGYPDLPAGKEHHIANNSNDTTYDHCLVLGLNAFEPFVGFPLGGFLLGAGTGNRCIGCAAAGISKGVDPSGYHWPSQTNRNDGGTTWEFTNNVAHNNGYKQLFVGDGIFVWQNSPDDHLVEGFRTWRLGNTGVDHGSYVNHYEYRDVVIDGARGAAMQLHPVSVNGKPMIFEEVKANGPLAVRGHQISGDNTPTRFIRCRFTSVTVNEVAANRPSNPSIILFEDCDLHGVAGGGAVPADFVMTAPHSQSVFEIWQGGVLAHRWTAGVWS